MKFRWFGIRSLSGIIFDRSIRITFLVLIAMIISLSVSAETWKGREETKEGILHVVNPAEPIAGPATLSPGLL